MFGIKREYWACGGETVLKKSKYDEDVAKTRATQRAQLDNQALQYTRSVEGQQTQLQAQTQVQPNPPFVATLLRAGVQMLMTPVRWVANTFQKMARMIPMAAKMAAKAGQNVLARAEKVISQVLTFFFGHRKERSEKEQDKRRKNDFIQVGLSGERKVEETMGSTLGGGNQ